MSIVDTKFNQSPREPCYFSHVHMLFEKVLVFGGQLWSHSQLAMLSEEKDRIMNYKVMI